MRNLLKYFFLIFYPVYLINAQDRVLGPEAYNWFFGEKSGITFNTIDKKPIPIHSSLVTEEGSAVISDENGDLLFYAQGDKIWNKNHDIMSNGSGLYGGNSSTQAVLIVQQPQHNKIFYVFNTCELGGPLFYSIVDLERDNGLGEVIEKSTKVYESCTEKLISIVHSNQTDVWIIVREKLTYNFRSYLLTKDGLSSFPVISTINLNYDISQLYSPMGYLAVSADGTRIAAATFSASEFELYDFSASSGIVSNPIVLPIEPQLIQSALTYGVCFSSDASKLYGSFSDGGNYSYLVQYDLTSGSGVDILKSREILATTSDAFVYGAIQAAPDGRLYISKNRNRFLSYIDKPDLKGNACGFIKDGIFLDGTLCRLGLPNFAYQKLYVVDKPDPKIHKSIIRIGSIEGKPGDKDKEIPVFAKLLADSTINQVLGYSITIQFNASVYLPENFPGVIENTVKDGVRTMKISGTIGSLSTEDIELLRLKGTLLLGNKTKSEVKILEFTWSDSTLITFLEPGYIMLSEVCKSDLRGVEFIPRLKADIVSNIVRDYVDVDIQTDKDDDAELILFSSVGSVSKSENIHLVKSKDGSKHRINLKGIPGGVYFIEVKSTFDRPKIISFIKL